MRAASRIADVSINTVTKLMVEAGEACAAYHDGAVRDVDARKVWKPSRALSGAMWTTRS